LKVVPIPSFHFLFGSLAQQQPANLDVPIKLRPNIGAKLKLRIVLCFTGFPSFSEHAGYVGVVRLTYD